MPVLVIHGDADPDPVAARRVAELAPLGEWSPLLDAGHSPWLEQPVAVQQRLIGFLDSIER
jgi:pimeloyl-ACP methyl ester carboxylesterase